MSVNFDVLDRIHNIIAKFVQTFLPEANKPYNLKPVHQPVLDVHGIASKADVYNVQTSPETIEEGFNAALKLMRYLSADGYIINTPLFRLGVRIPGEYDGTETRLPDGVHPVVRLRTSRKFREYIRDRVQISFDGVFSKNGFIAAFLDVEDNETNTTFTPGHQFVLTGADIMVAGDDPSCGVSVVPVDNPSAAVRVGSLARNSRSQIIGLSPTTGYQRNKIVIKTQYMGSSTKFLKTVRVIESSFIIEEV